MHFRDVATARLHSARNVKIEVLVLLPVYLGKRVSKVKVDDIPPEVDVAIVIGIEEAVTVFHAAFTPERNWQEQSWDMVIQMSAENQEKVVETIAVQDMVLRMKSENRIPRCFKCGPKETAPCHPKRMEGEKKL